MKRAERIRASADFAAVRARGRAVHGAAATLSWVGTAGVELDGPPEGTVPAPPSRRAQNRFGFVVGKRVGHAVQRNLVKRRLRALMDARKGALKPGHDIVIIARPGAAQRTFAELAHEVERLLQRSRLYSTVTTTTAEEPSGAAQPTATSTHQAE
jgi:ribonuclease P protein component